MTGVQTCALPIWAERRIREEKTVSLVDEGVKEWARASKLEGGASEKRRENRFTRGRGRQGVDEGINAGGGSVVDEKRRPFN